MDRRRRLPKARTALLSRSARNCRWSSSAKGVLDPHQAVSAIGQPLQSEHVEAHRMRAPLGLTLPEVARGANDFALLVPGDRAASTAEIPAFPLTYFDDGQHGVIEA